MFYKVGRCQILEVRMRCQRRRRWSRLGGATPVAGGMHQGPVRPKARWGKRREAEVFIRILRGEPQDTLSRELGLGIYLCNNQWLTEKNGRLSPTDARRSYHEREAA